MRIRTSQSKILLLALAVALSIAGCSALPFASGPKAPCSVTVSSQAADNLISRIDAAEATTGPMTFTATSQEMTSLLVQSIQQAKQQDPSAIIPVQNPIVCFTNGKMSVFATLSAQGIPAVDALITMSGAVINGKTSFRVEEIQFGQFSAPQALGDTVASLAEDALNQRVDRFRLTTVQIGNGQMTVSGVAQ